MNIFEHSGDVSAHFCNCDPDPPSSEGKVVCSRPEGIRDAQVGCFGNFHLYMCRIAKVCTVLKKEICSLHPLKMLFTGVKTQFFSMGQRDFFQVSIPHLNGSLPKGVPRLVQKTRGLHLVPEQEGWEVAGCFKNPVLKL